MDVVAPDARLRPRPGIESRIVDGGGALIVDLDSGACWELNAVGSEVWAHLTAGETPGATTDALAARYTVTREVLEADVQALCRALLDAGLLMPADAPRPPQQQPASAPR